MDGMDAQEVVKEAEIELLTSATRNHADRVRALLSPDFVEIGRSGRCWNREEIVAVLAEEPPRKTPVTDEWNFVRLGDEYMLVTYVIHGAESDSRHSSVWHLGDGSPVMCFHQGTVVTI